ncbi:MAG: hypothetical protein HYU86_11575 [Chloroflexi bacterium]|nr:hypothetical protein [Chloroflexota bacterium]
MGEKDEEELKPSEPDAWLALLMSYLALFMSDEEAERYSSLEGLMGAIDLVKQGELCWQALVSIAIYFRFLSFLRFSWKPEEIELKQSPLSSIAAAFLEPCEALLASLTERAERGPLTDEEARVLFHTRFALGWVCLTKGDLERAMQLWHAMAATRLSVEYGPGGTTSFPQDSGVGVLTNTADIVLGKCITAISMPYVVSQSNANYYIETLYAIKSAGRSSVYIGPLAEFACKLLDSWAEACEKKETCSDEEKYEIDYRFYDWISLFLAASDILGFCRQWDCSDALPSEYNKESAQYLAWKFGQLVGRYAMVEKFRANPWKGLERFFDVFTGILKEDYAEYAKEDLAVVEGEYRSAATAATLVSEYDPQRDWSRAREFYIHIWHHSDRWGGAAVHEIGPHMDLYWAMRIGFADKILESLGKEQSLVPSPQTIEPSTPRWDIQAVGDMDSRISINVMKILHEVKEMKQSQDERLLPSEGKILQSLEGYFSGICPELSSDAVDALIAAEWAYQSGSRTGTSTKEVIKRFHAAVEACLRRYFIYPFGDYLTKDGLPSVSLCFWNYNRQKKELVEETCPVDFLASRVSLSKWCGIFEAVNDPSLKGKENLHVKTFVRRRWPKLNLGEIKVLVEPLGKIQRQRNIAEHGLMSYKSEREALEKLRELVLGIRQPSVIEQIYRIFGSRHGNQGSHP